MIRDESPPHLKPVRSPVIPQPRPRSTRPSPAGFELISELGRGGMGVVYKAKQTALNRVVALKMVLGGHHAHESDRLRFLSEAEAIASVKHPNVVQVYEFGYCDGQPYYAMEYLGGGSLARQIAKHGRMPATAAARLVEQVARGVQAAHDVGLIHRDLKPANILLGNAECGMRNADSKSKTASGDEAVDSVTRIPNSEFVPKVTDFGLAKRATGANITRSGVMVGTPAYMAPEQAFGKAKFVGAAADVYALGGILYECLTGRPPFAATETAVVLTRLTQEDPTPIRHFAPNVPGDLELICLKCLAKTPAERYPTAAALADDLNRFVAGEPVTVRPAGRIEKVVKWIGRDPTRAVAYGLTLLTAALLGLTTSALKLWREAEAAKRFAFSARDAVEAARGDADMAQSRAEVAELRLAVEKSFRVIERTQRELQRKNVERARALLAEVPADLRAWEWRYLNRLTRESDAVPRVTLAGFRPTDTPTRIALLPDGRLYVASDQTEACYDLRTGTVSPLAVPANSRDLFSMPSGETLRVQSPDKSRIITAGHDGVVTLWDTTTGRDVLVLREMGARAEAVAFSPDGAKVLALDERGVLYIFDAGPRE